MKILSSIIIFLLLAYGVYTTRYRALELRYYATQKFSGGVPLYLPQKDAVKVVTLGYDHTMSVLFWFSTLNYVGAQLEAKKSMPWFRHMCDLVTELDVRARHVFEFCGTLLSWVGKDIEGSNEILSKGIREDSSYWRYWYLRGFNNWYFFEDFERATEDITTASRMPDAPSFLAPLASKIMMKHENTAMAIRFLKASIQRTKDISAKTALEAQLQQAYVRRDVDALNRVMSQYSIRTGEQVRDLHQLVTAKLITHVPKDPYGDEYEIGKEGKAVSKTGGSGLRFTGKTARTGIARHEGWDDVLPKSVEENKTQAKAN